MKLSKYLQKLAYRLKKTSLPPFEYYSSYGWITPHGVLYGEVGGDHSTVLDANADLLGEEYPRNYQPAFDQRWVRWYIHSGMKEIGFESTREGFAEHHNEIQKLIDQNPDNRVFIELIDANTDLIEEFRFEIPSAAEKAFQRGGIPALENYNKPKSELRKFL